MTKGSTVRVPESRATQKVRNTGAWGWLPAVTRDPPPPGRSGAPLGTSPGQELELH